jgi:hypothetical protein
VRGFRAERGGGASTRFGESEAALVRTLALDVSRLLHGDGDVRDEMPSAERDPLEELTGMSTPSVGLPGDPDAVPPRLPDDPALARLLPDAYRLDDPAAADDPDYRAYLADAAADYRRFTEGELRAGKLAALQRLLDTLPEGGGQVRLDAETASVWLGALNDVRLVLASRLEVTEETAEAEVDPADPRAPALEVYDFLGWLQDSLVRAVAGW